MRIRSLYLTSISAVASSITFKMKLIATSLIVSIVQLQRKQFISMLNGIPTKTLHHRYKYLLLSEIPNLSIREIQVKSPAVMCHYGKTSELN